MKLASSPSPRSRFATSFLLLNALGWAAVIAQQAWLHRDPSANGRPTLDYTSAREGNEFSERTPLTWHFSQPMVPDAEIGRVLQRPPATLTPPLAGRFVWSTSEDLLFVPDAAWPPSSELRVVFSRDLWTADGRRVRLSGRAFATSTARIRVDQVEDLGETEDGARRRLRLVFNLPPDFATLGKALSLRTPGGEELPFTLDDVVAPSRVQALSVALDPQRVDRVMLTLAAEALRPAQGALGPTKDQQFAVNLLAGMAVKDVEANTPGFGNPEIWISFSQDVSPTTARPFITISPEVPFTVAHRYDWWESHLTLQGPFVPGVPYDVTIAAGLPTVRRSDQGGALLPPPLPGSAEVAPLRLPAKVVRRVVFRDRPASIAFADEGRHLASGHPLRLGIRSVNTPVIEVNIERLRTQNLVAFVQAETKERWWRGETTATENLTGHVATRRITPGGKPNEAVDNLIDLREGLPADAIPGAYLVTLSTPPVVGVYSGNTTASRVVVVSDLGLAARVSEDRVLVWTTSLTDATPLADTRVTLLSGTNDRLAEGVTAPDGTVELKFAKEGPLVLVATHGNDTAFLSLDDAYDVTPEATAPRDARPYAETPHEAFVYTDRGICRPGETVHAKAVVRDASNRPPKPFPVRFRLVRPDGRIATETTIPLSDLGTAETDFAFAPEWPTGGYAVRLTLPADDAELGSTDVALEEIVPPQIAVDVTVAEARGATGDDLPFDVASHHLFGTPAAGLPCEAQVRFDPIAFAPPEWPGYTFGDTSKRFPAETVSLNAKALDADGTAHFRVEAKDTWRPPAALQATFAVSVQQSGGRAVVATATRCVDPYPHYIGVKPSRAPGALRAGVDESVEFAVVAPDGTLAAEPPAALKATLARLSRSTLLRRQDDGSFRYITETLVDPVKTTDIALTDARALFALVLPGPGDYRLTVEDADSGASTSLDLSAAALDSQWAHAGTDAPESIALQPDRTAYAPGDVARITVKAPFSGLALLTLEDRGTLRHQLLTLTNTAAVVEVPLGLPGVVPSVQVSMTLLRAATPEPRWSAHRANGAVLLRVLPPERALAVTLEAPESIRPASPLTVRVVVKDADGQPAPNAEVTVAAVDEGLCLLTAFKTPDPLAWFNAVRLAGIQHFDLFGRLLPVFGEDRVALVSQVAGDGGVALAQRLNPFRTARFRTVALWSGTVRTDAEGGMVAKFEVPEFTGQLRLMAVAVGPERYGCATGATLVKRPIVVQSSLPRFAAPGDTFTATVELFNQTDERQTVTLNADVEGPLTLTSALGLAPLEARERRSVPLTFAAAATPGVARVTLAVAAPAADSAYRETFELPVRPASALVATVVAGRLAPGESLPLEAAEPMVAGTVRSRVACSPRPETDLGEALDELLRYPYGCLEQTVSSAFPLLYFNDLARTLRPELFLEGQTRDLVAAGIGRVLAMQREDGAFGYWPRLSDPYPWGSLYATHFLTEAKRAGFEVAEFPYKAALNHLAATLRSAPIITGSNASWQDDMRRRAYACHVLALAGRYADARSWADRLRELADRLPHDARANLAAALLHGGQPREAAAVLRSATPPAVPYRDGGESLASDIRDTALLLAAWCDLDPEAAELPGLAARLDRSRKHGAWQTTQDNAVALMALGKFYRTLPIDRRGYRGTLTVGDGVEPIGFTHAAPFRWQSPDVADAVGLKLRNEGPGTLFYSLRQEGVPLKPATEPLNEGLSIEREWLNIADGLPLPRGADGTAELEQGTLIAVRLTLDVPTPLDGVVIADLLPAGLEIENPELNTSAANPAWMGKLDQGWVLHREIRDDRLLLFTQLVRGRNVFDYTVRAVTPGRYVVPAVRAEAMYDPGRFGQSAPDRLVVK